MIVAKLYFYYSAMNAGKTTSLLQSEYNYRERGMNTLLFIPIFDDRYEKGYIASRIGLKAQAVPFDTGFNFYEFVEKKIKEPDHRIKCVLVDEAQFSPVHQHQPFCLDYQCVRSWWLFVHSGKWF